MVGHGESLTIFAVETRFSVWWECHSLRDARVSDRRKSSESNFRYS